MRALARTAVLAMVAVGLLALLAFAVRASDLSAAGFAEDELDKLYAAQSYAKGNFAADGEHPALMKLAALASLQLPGMTAETAVRLPNAVAGALIVVLLFLLVRKLFDGTTAAVAALLWTVNVNGIAVNRIAKEDTFVLLFLLLGAYLFERGKETGRVDPRRAQRWFVASGAAFGLMMASKYMPYYFGLHVLFMRAAEPHPGKNRPDKLPWLGALAAAFLLANFPILIPGNWRTIAGFLREDAVAHSGYLFQGTLWLNNMSATPWGLPVWFYATQLATKIPVPVLAAFGAGAWQLWRRRRERGAVFLRVFLLFTLVPYSLVATKFTRYSLPALAMVDIVAAVGVVWLVRRYAARAAWQRVVAVAGAAAVVVAASAATVTSMPHPSLYRNVIGESLSPHALWFAPDELYDAGLREAVAHIATAAAPGAHVITEAPAVVGYYASARGRADLVITRTFNASAAAADTWFLVQDGRLYFENLAVTTSIRNRFVAHDLAVGGFRAVQVFHLWTGAAGD